MVLQGRAVLSSYLITHCGYTYSVRLVKLLCRSHGVAAVSLWGGATNHWDGMSKASAVYIITDNIEVTTGIAPADNS
jgi:hypothetical protein